MRNAERKTISTGKSAEMEYGMSGESLTHAREEGQKNGKMI